jgi:hypothetical protein
LIGLSSQETEEFLELEKMMSNGFPGLINQTWTDDNERRWTELFEKHEVANDPLAKVAKTKH